MDLGENSTKDRKSTQRNTLQNRVVKFIPLRNNPHSALPLPLEQVAQTQGAKDELSGTD